MSAVGDFPSKVKERLRCLHDGFKMDTTCSICSAEHFDCCTVHLNSLYDRVGWWMGSKRVTGDEMMEEKIRGVEDFLLHARTALIDLTIKERDASSRDVVMLCKGYKP